VNLVAALPLLGSLHSAGNFVAPYGASELGATGDPGFLLGRHLGLYSVVAQGASKNRPQFDNSIAFR